MLLKGKNVLVVGFAVSGISTVNTLLKLGAHITINDQKSINELKDKLEMLDSNNVNLLLGQEPTNLSEFDYIILSPGVPTDLPFIEKAKAMNITVIGELELAYQLCKGRFVVITGTNGKTTTTALVGEIFKNAQVETYVVGNIGVAAIGKALEASKDAVMVTEASSFQLESTVNFKPFISAILNITPDHLNRHKTMENYISAKSKIYQNQDSNNFVVLNADNELTYDLRDKTNSNVILFSRKKRLEYGAYVLDHNIVVQEKGKFHEIICSVEALKIPGAHNLENALAAAAIAYWAGISKNVIAKTLSSFMGVEHRIELVDEIEGVRFINDSKGTNPDASIKAIEAVKAPIILIAGGMDKGSSFEEFIYAFSGKVKHMVLLGETAEKIRLTAEAMGFSSITMVKNMEEAVEVSFEKAQVGDTVLLSPACASWDMYPSFEVRGGHFKNCVKRLRRP